MISVSFFHVLLWIIEENALGGGVLNFFCPRVEIRPSKKLPGGFVRGDGQAWNWLIQKDFYLLTLFWTGSWRTLF